MACKKTKLKLIRKLAQKLADFEKKTVIIHSTNGTFEFCLEENKKKDYIINEKISPSSFV